MTVDGNTINITTQQEIQEAGGVRTRRITQQLSLPSGVQGHLVQTSVREGELVISAPRGEWSVENPGSKPKLERPSSIPITKEQEEPFLTPEQSPIVETPERQSKLGRSTSIPITVEKRPTKQEEPTSTPKRSSVTAGEKGTVTDSPSKLGRPISIPITIEQEDPSPTSVPDRAKSVKKTEYDDLDYD